ncbi:hypothetical protein FVE85_8304 [Porphyridium purpureum]|uniref:C2H2-type domain-containing protein n=1 Tax=Porphyridium purpureum TaxID=35688 RepID=A0A5J4YLF7_PORPP|nr:hypothetical protein FVE85_8304 [Porphyridium purpureum]|eukprot:POR8847..scf244_11
MKQCDRIQNMKSAFGNDSQANFRRLRSFFHRYSPEVQKHAHTHRADPVEHLQSVPLVSHMRLIRVLKPLHNDQILRNLIMSGNASVVQVGQSSSGQPVLSVMSNTCLAHYEFQALALDDDLCVLNALCIVVRSSDEEIELLEVAEISNAYVLVSLVTFHRTKARKGTSLLLDGISGLEDPRLFDRVKGALTLEAYPTDPTLVPASQHQLDPRICADWDFWSAELPRWGIMKCMTRIEILSQFGQEDYEKAAIWFLAECRYLQHTETGTPIRYHGQASQSASHPSPRHVLLQLPQQQAPQHQVYPNSYQVARPPVALEWDPPASTEVVGINLGVALSYASSSGVRGQPPQHPATLIRPAGNSSTEPTPWAAVTPRVESKPARSGASASAGSAFIPAGHGQKPSPESHRSQEGTPPSPRPDQTLTKYKPCYECAGCPAVLSHNSNLERHVQVCHESIWRHVCDFCGWAFAQGSDLKKHALTKHPNKYYEMFGVTGTVAGEQGPIKTADTADSVVEAEASFSQPIASNSEPGPSAPTSASGQQAPAVPASASEALDLASGSPRVP